MRSLGRTLPQRGEKGRWKRTGDTRRIEAFQARVAVECIASHTKIVVTRENEQQADEIGGTHYR